MKRRVSRITQLLARVVLLTLCAVLAGLSAMPAGADSVARQWNELLLEAIRNDTARPTIHARNLWHTSAAMYDTWAAFDTTASQYLVNERVDGPLDEAARDEAISYAAYRIIGHRFVNGPGGTGPGVFDTLVSLFNKMNALDYDPAINTTVGDSPAALGNRIAQAYIDYGLTDGSNEPADYADPSGYAPVNPPMTFDNPGTAMTDPNRWQPLTFLRERRDQFGTIITEQTQTFLSPYWGDVKSFALPEKQPGEVHHDQGPPPQLGGDGDAEFRSSANEVIRYSSRLDPSQSTTIDISPASLGNRPLGSYDGPGYDVNPYTGEPYEPNPVSEADYGRVVAEFWADGPDSEAPPGHWNVIANRALDRMNELDIAKRVGGTGPVVGDLEYDIKTYFALNAAVHDAGVAAWNHKGTYDYSRPVSMIRYMGQRGQSSDPDGPSYHPEGLTLEPGLVEVITEDTTAPGGRHEHLAGSEGKIAIYAWKGPPGEPHDEPDDLGGVDWVLAENWLPYQRDTFVTPPFAAYLSGHSTFSRAAAEVLAAITGDPYFPGGVGEHTIPMGDGLEFEYGPSEEVVLQWATYFDASDEAGVSRLWGGIHVRADDLPGRVIGSEVGQDVWALAARYFNGSVPEPGAFAVLGVGLMMIARRRRYTRTSSRRR